MGYAVPLRPITGIRFPGVVGNPAKRALHASSPRLKPILEPRLEDHGHVIHDKYSVIRDSYGSLPLITALLYNPIINS